MSPALAYFFSCIIFSFSLTKHILAAQTFSPVKTHTKFPLTFFLTILYPSPASNIQYFCRAYMLSLSTSLPPLLEPATVWFCLILVHHSNILFCHLETVTEWLAPSFDCFCHLWTHFYHFTYSTLVPQLCPPYPWFLPLNIKIPQNSVLIFREGP